MKYHRRARSNVRSGMDSYLLHVQSDLKTSKIDVIKLMQSNDAHMTELQKAGTINVQTYLARHGRLLNSNNNAATNNSVLMSSLNKASETTLDYIRGVRHGDRLSARNQSNNASTTSEKTTLRARQIGRVRVPHSASVDEMLTENEALKRDLLSTIDEMGMRLDK